MAIGYRLSAIGYRLSAIWLSAIWLSAIWLFGYRLTGIHLMRTGEVQANLVTLNEGEFRLPYIADLVARKLAGPEKSKLEDADIQFHESEYQRLRGELQAAHEASKLPELPSEETRAALNGLLVRVRLKS